MNIEKSKLNKLLVLAIELQEKMKKNINDQAFDALNIDVDKIIESVTDSAELISYLKTEGREFTAKVAAIMYVGRDIPEGESLTEYREYFDEMYKKWLIDDYTAEQITDKFRFYDYFVVGLNKLNINI